MNGKSHSQIKPSIKIGALIALAFVLIQQSGPSCPAVVDFRKTVLKTATDKGEDSIVKVLFVLLKYIQHNYKNLKKIENK
jgi:hypothetical protein